MWSDRGRVQLLPQSRSSRLERLLEHACHSARLADHARDLLMRLHVGRQDDAEVALSSRHFERMSRVACRVGQGVHARSVSPAAVHH